MIVELSKNEDPCVAKGHDKNVATIGGPQQPPNISHKNQECFAEHVSSIPHWVGRGDIGNWSWVNFFVKVSEIKLVSLLSPHAVVVSLC